MGYLIQDKQSLPDFLSHFPVAMSIAFFFLLFNFFKKVLETIFMPRAEVKCGEQN